MDSHALLRGCNWFHTDAGVRALPSALKLRLIKGGHAYLVLRRHKATCGDVDLIEKFADNARQVGLKLSMRDLHFPLVKSIEKDASLSAIYTRFMTGFNFIEIEAT
ncbi:hypothetical protein CYMTET_31398 [Cymbomonas tetramitiformis]|uniref:Uncharacterized protein n=1 Tax=Cymbomonas tetramitiformis TaxID=36881 RepID=A0AAE0FH72_9CHLO|nr:hypothetical protein CYMTET_31398 [Cymbomonas tetramitiformis]